MRGGDSVRHKPTGEKWLLAWVENGEVGACGWPETIARESDCVLVRSCTDAEHRKMLEECSRSGSYRGAVCSNQLAALNAGQVVEAEGTR